MRFIAILNPAADNGRTGRRRHTVEAALQAAGLTFDLWLTEGPGHAVALARRAAAQAEVVVAVGGDGTIQEVSRGLIEGAEKAHLGILPLGTGNDFVKMIGMPLEPYAAARLLARASPRAVDYGVVRWEVDGTTCEQIFINAVGVGFDARAAIEAHTLKHLPGITGYLAAVLRTLRHWESPVVCVRGSEAPSAVPRVLYDGPLLLVTAANGVSSGGMFRLTPGASITDGLLDVCLVENTSTRRILQVIPQAIRGRHEMAREVHTFRVHILYITSEQGLPVHADGEILARDACRVEIEVRAGKLSVLMPQ